MVNLCSLLIPVLEKNKKPERSLCNSTWPWHQILPLSVYLCFLSQSASLVWSASSSVPLWWGASFRGRAASVWGPWEPSEPAGITSLCTIHTQDFGLRHAGELGPQRWVGPSVAALLKSLETVARPQSLRDWRNRLQGSHDAGTVPVWNLLKWTKRKWETECWRVLPTHQLPEALGWDWSCTMAPSVGVTAGCTLPSSLTDSERWFLHSDHLTGMGLNQEQLDLPTQTYGCHT